MRGKPALPSVPLTQQAFFFVDADDRQQMADQYERQRLKHIKRFIRNTEDAAPVVRVEVLIQPIFTKQGQQAFEVFTADPLEAPDESAGVAGDEQFACGEQEKAEIINWFADRAEQFIGYVIDQAVEALASIGNAQEKAHILQWMFAADIHGYVIQEFDGQELTRPIFSRDVPMTFQWCCRVHGLSVERFQQSVLDALKFAEAEIRNRENNGELKPGRHLVYRQARELVDHL
jgi:hypothetical protein